MKKNLLAASLLAMVGGLGGAVVTAGEVISSMANIPPPRRQPGVRAYRSRGFLYPEQSSRQAMRAHRRQQGGPGIELNTRTGQYEAKTAS